MRTHPQAFPAFAWSNPTISQMDYDSDVWVRRVMRWVNGVAGGENDRRKVLNDASFVDGGTIGPAAAVRGRSIP